MESIASICVVPILFFLFSPWNKLKRTGSVRGSNKCWANRIRYLSVLSFQLQKTNRGENEIALNNQNFTVVNQNVFPRDFFSFFFFGNSGTFNVYNIYIFACVGAHVCVFLALATWALSTKDAQEIAFLPTLL